MKSELIKQTIKDNFAGRFVPKRIDKKLRTIIDPHINASSDFYK